MWNDTDIPLAYLITFRTYGSWLHGDRRGSTNRFRNKYGTMHLPPEPRWWEENKDRMTAKPVRLDLTQRRIVDRSIRETCIFRGWALYATSVRSNHAHAVVCAGITGPGKVLNALKANATRALREGGFTGGGRSPWADKGSQIYLWNQQSVDRAVEYVLYEQGNENWEL